MCDVFRHNCHPQGDYNTVIKTNSNKIFYKIMSIKCVGFNENGVKTLRMAVGRCGETCSKSNINNQLEGNNNSLLIISIS